VQRAGCHLQAAGRKEVTAVNVLVAIFAEQESHAVYILNEMEVTRLDVVNFISHGVSKNAEQQEQNAASTSDKQVEDSAEGEQSALDQYATNLNRKAAEGRIDPLIGRAHEMERVVQ